MRRCTFFATALCAAEAAVSTVPISLGAGLVSSGCGSAITSSAQDDAGGPIEGGMSESDAKDASVDATDTGVDATEAGVGGGDGGDGALQPFPCFASEPLFPEITDFSGTDPAGTWGDVISGGGAYSYGGSSDGGMDLTGTVDLAAHTFRVTGRVTTYSGFGLYFNQCTDASRYRGVSFKLSGTIGGGAILFVPTVSETTPIDPVNMVGSCSFMNEQTKYAECVNPGTTVTPSGTVTVLWGQLMGGRPRATVNPAQIIGMQWVLVWTPGLASYSVDLALDDVAFVDGLAPIDGSTGTADSDARDGAATSEAARD